MATGKIVVDDVLSPGTVCAGGWTYVLRGMPDVPDDVPRFAEARELVARALAGSELSYDEETARELPDLPGTEIEAFSADGSAVVVTLAGKVSGVLVGHPFR